MVLGSADPFLRIAVFVPTRASWPEGWAASGALRMAVEELNRRPELLGGLKLQVAEKAIGCDSSSASAGLSVLLEEGRVDAVIGPWCSLGCESSAYITSGRDIVQISYSCTSPLLSQTKVSNGDTLMCARRFCRAAWNAHLSHSAPLHFPAHDAACPSCPQRFPPDSPT
jgi:hypothetical protein